MAALDEILGVGLQRPSDQALAGLRAVESAVSMKSAPPGARSGRLRTGDTGRPHTGIHLDSRPDTVPLIRPEDRERHPAYLGG